jgi:hypothetical protein
LRLRNPNLFCSTIPSLHCFTPPRTYSSSQPHYNSYHAHAPPHLVYCHMCNPTSSHGSLRVPILRGSSRPKSKSSN